MKNFSFKIKHIVITLIICFATVLVCSDLLRVRESLALQLGLPEPTELLKSAKAGDLAYLKGIKLDQDNPLNVQFLIQVNREDKLDQQSLSDLVRYFMAALTISEQDLWVNLSPYERDRVTSKALSQTDLGQDLLAQDYILKQLSSSLSHPNTDLGQEYWKSRSGSQNLSPENKIWIVPENVEIIENGAMALVKNLRFEIETENPDSSNILLPKIKKEVNTSEHFAKLRQLSHSVLLASWLKKSFKQSIYKSYIDQNKINGIDSQDKENIEKIWTLYCESFRRGVYDLIQKDESPKQAKKRYFSGGAKLNFSKKSISSSIVQQDIVDLSKLINDQELFVANVEFINQEASVEQIDNAIMEIWDVLELTTDAQQAITLTEHLEGIYRANADHASGKYSKPRLLRTLEQLKVQVKGMQDYTDHLSALIEKYTPEVYIPAQNIEFKEEKSNEEFDIEAYSNDSDVQFFMHKFAWHDNAEKFIFESFTYDQFRNILGRYSKEYRFEKMKQILNDMKDEGLVEVAAKRTYRFTYSGRALLLMALLKADYFGAQGEVHSYLGQFFERDLTNLDELVHVYNRSSAEQKAPQRGFKVTLSPHAIHALRKFEKIYSRVKEQRIVVPRILKENLGKEIIKQLDNFLAAPKELIALKDYIDATPVNEFSFPRWYTYNGDKKNVNNKIANYVLGAYQDYPKVNARVTDVLDWFAASGETIAKERLFRIYNAKGLEQKAYNKYARKPELGTQLFVNFLKKVKAGDIKWAFAENTIPATYSELESLFGIKKKTMEKKKTSFLPGWKVMHPLKPAPIMEKPLHDRVRIDWKLSDEEFFYLNELDKQRLKSKKEEEALNVSSSLGNMNLNEFLNLLSNASGDEYFSLIKKYHLLKRRELWVSGSVKDIEQGDYPVYDYPDYAGVEPDFAVNTEGLLSNLFLGLKNNIALNIGDIDILVMDNHNYALPFILEKAGSAQKLRMMHIDEHEDLAENYEYENIDFDSGLKGYLDHKQLMYKTAIDDWQDLLFSQINDKQTVDHRQWRGAFLAKPGSGKVFNYYDSFNEAIDDESFDSRAWDVFDIDIDFLQPLVALAESGPDSDEMKRKIEETILELAKTVVESKAKIVTVATSPGFIAQEKALVYVRKLLGEIQKLKEEEEALNGGIDLEAFADIEVSESAMFLSSSLEDIPDIESLTFEVKYLEPLKSSKELEQFVAI